MKLGVVGCGTVGRAMVRAYVEHVEEVRVHDVLPERSTHALADVLVSDLIMVALPTPQRASGAGLDCSAVFDFFSQVAGSDACLVLRSTVPIGTTRELQRTYRLPQLCHSPEFLTARTAAADARSPRRNVIGVPSLIEQRCFTALYSVYQRRFPEAPILAMSSDESEAVKLADNAFGAVKVSFFNELHALCDAAGLSFDAVRLALIEGGRIGRHYTDVPGPDGLFGWGGECWPKDVPQFVSELERRGLRADVVRGARSRNLLDRGRKT